MSYTTGQRVQSWDGKRRGTVTRDASAYSSVWVLWDGAESERQELPECVMLQAQQPTQSARDAWLSQDVRLKKASKAR